MIQDLALRWAVTLLFLFSAGVCVQAIVADRHRGADLVSHGLHAVMAIAMAVMAWPRGADLPSRAPMIFFAVAALWFAVIMFRRADHKGPNAYHMFMMAAMAWMYAAMGGLPLKAASWIGWLNWVCTIGFALAAAYWFYRLVTARLQPSADAARESVVILCQLAMAAGMGVMFAVMLG